jgi:hypothetical protein
MKPQIDFWLIAKSHSGTKLHFWYIAKSHYQSKIIPLAHCQKPFRSKIILPAYCQKSLPALNYTFGTLPKAIPEPNYTLGTLPKAIFRAKSYFRHIAKTATIAQNPFWLLSERTKTVIELLFYTTIYMNFFNLFNHGQYYN